MKEQGITYLPDYKAARAVKTAQAAEDLKVLEEARPLELHGIEQETELLAASGGGGGATTVSATRTPPGKPPSGPKTTETAKPATTTSGAPTGGPTGATRHTAIKRIGPDTGPSKPLDPTSPADVERAEELTESLEQLKNRGTPQTPLREIEVVPQPMGAYYDFAGDSRLLGRRLAEAGMPKPSTVHQAHHIVPANEAAAQQVRDFLRSRGFTDINHVDNGVWLPTGRSNPNVTAEFLHDYTFGRANYNAEYFHRLEDILMSNPNITPKQIGDRLRWIRSYLQEGKLPPPQYPGDLPPIIGD
jgi:hypothetical protein